MRLFVSFLYPFIDRGQGPLCRWLMLLQMDRMGPDEVCFIGDAATFAEDGLPFGEECEVAGFVFRAPSQDRYREFRKLQLSREPFDRLLASSRGMLDAYRRMLTEDVPELRLQIDAHLASIQERRPSCAILTWANCPSLYQAARARGIPVIHNELGPLRAPYFVPTIYFDFEGVNGRTSALRASTRHIDELGQLSLADVEPRVAELYVGNDPDHDAAAVPEFDAGVALQVEDDSNVIAHSNGWSTLELLQFVVYRHGTARTLVRTHPASAFRLWTHVFGRVDDSRDSIVFLLRARELYTINSSVASEAAFFRRRFHVLGENPVSMLVDAPGGDRVRDARRAFYFLAYLVPACLAFDRDYYEWRLSDPAWEEIADRHLDAIRSERTRIDQEARLVKRVQPASTELPDPADTPDWLAGRSLNLQLRAIREYAEWLRTSLEECREQLATANEARAWLEEEKSKWQRAAEEAGARFADLESRLREAGDTNRWLDEQRRAWDNEAAAKDELVERLEKEAERVQEGARWAEQQRGAWETVASQKDAELAKKVEELDELRRRAEQERMTWEGVVAEKDAQLALKVEEVARLQDSLRRLADERERDLALASGRIRELVASCDELGQANRSYQAQVQLLESRLRSALRSLRQRRHELAALLTSPVVRTALSVGLASRRERGTSSR